MLARLLEHDYPGDVRVLENIIERAFVLCRSAAEAVSPNIAGMTLEAMERFLIANARQRHNGNRTAAVRQSGINPSTLFRKLKSLGIERK